MKKKLFAGMLASATVLGMFVAGGTALAAEVDTTDTEVGIGFSLHQPGGSGDLKLRWTPIELDFGSANTVNTAVQDFDEQDEAGGVHKYAVVEDARDHTSGDVEWKLTAKVADLVSTSNPATKLDGAVLKFDTDKHGYQGTVSPEIAGIISATASHTATMAANYSLTTGAATATEVMKDGDVGSSVTSYEGTTAMEMKNIKLTVPANVAKKGHHYTGDLTWSLDDTI
ncbi:hypothetical protein IGI39_004684 [Enterococcus sp. AZ135]|uniref:WxL domain-containing protein n=1 Tax=unclassified Enterococcus TaxID=2608891 RepID=UPI003F247946